MFGSGTCQLDLLAVQLGPDLQVSPKRIPTQLCFL